jgi:kinesin family protein 6/9
MGRSRDSIKIFLRLRPHRKHEGAVANYELEHTFDESRITFHLDRRNLEQNVVNSTREDYEYRFDRIYDQTTSQEEIFDAVAKDSVMSVLEGYNSTIFAYGQTGSGKTFTITGGTESYDDRGIIPRCIKLIYDEVKRRGDSHHTSVTLSYMQIYNGKGMDLLNRGKDARTIDELPLVTVHETEDEIILKGLEAHTATNTHEALNLLFLGDTNRLYSETPMNASSSRSHCIFSIMLESRLHGSPIVTRSKLNLVDLAGSERVAKTGISGNLLTEAKHINVSLFHLEHVINALAEGRDHIPFRDSLMTMALKDSLGSNCRTSMIAAAHPAELHVMETISTCRFAMRVASITQKAVVNQETDPAILIRQLKKEVAALKEQVAFLSQGKDTDPSRTLSADETARCREAVSRFVADTDGNAELSGLGGDLARINFCFRYLKTLAAGGGGGGGPRPGSSSSAGAPSVALVPAAATSVSDEERQAMLEQIRRLQVSVQQKENELALLFQMMDSHRDGPLAGSVDGGSASQGSALAGGPRDLRASTGSATSGASTSGAPSTVAANPNSIMSQLRGVAAQAAAPASPAGGPQLPGSLTEGYDLDKLSDPALLKDRQAAFDAFRKSYRRYEQVEKNQDELRDRIASAKNIAARYNGTLERMKEAKDQLRQLRAERALIAGQGEEDIGPEERAAKRRLDELRSEVAKITDELKEQKERIDFIKHALSKAQEQLIRDFEQWFKTRQAQVAAAMRAGAGTNVGGNSQASPLPAASARADSGSAFTAQQHLLQRLDMQRHEERMQTELTPAYASTPVAAYASTPVGSGYGATPSVTAAGVGRGMVSTGNPEADAELLRLYRAREDFVARQQQRQV